MTGPKIVSVKRRESEDVLGRNIIIEIVNGPQTESWDVELSPYEAEKICLKLAELADLKVA